MILLRVLSDKEEIIKKAAELLLKENLAIDLNLSSGTKRLALHGQRISESNHFLISAKTKGLLFQTIDDRFRKEFSKSEMPELYSVPIIHMDWDEMAHVTQDTRPV